MKTAAKKRISRLYRLLARLRMALTQESVHVGAGGARYYINRYSYIERLVAVGEFERTRVGFLAERLKAEVAFVDIGANIGFFSMLAGRLGARVHAFEPEPNNFHRLQRNVKLNGFTPQQFTAFNCALGREKGEVCLHRPLTDNYGKASIGLMEEADTVKVPLQRLDALLKPTKARHTVKIDVEGAELQVLDGAGSLIDTMPAGSQWLVEVHRGCGVEISAVAARFLPYGYQVSYFDDATGRLGSVVAGDDDVLLVAER